MPPDHGSVRAVPRHYRSADVLEQRTSRPSLLVCARLLSDWWTRDVRCNGSRHGGSDPGMTVRMLRTAKSGQAPGAGPGSLVASAWC